MKRMRIAKFIYFGLLFIAYGAMTAGYMMRGEVWYDAAYYAFQAFLVNFKDGPTQENSDIFSVFAAVF